MKENELTHYKNIRTNYEKKTFKIAITLMHNTKVLHFDIYMFNCRSLRKIQWTSLPLWKLSSERLILFLPLQKIWNSNGQWSTREIWPLRVVAPSTHKLEGQRGAEAQLVREGTLWPMIIIQHWTYWYQSYTNIKPDLCFVVKSNIDNGISTKDDDHDSVRLISQYKNLMLLVQLSSCFIQVVQARAMTILRALKS